MGGGSRRSGRFVLSDLNAELDGLAHSGWGWRPICNTFADVNRENTELNRRSTEEHRSNRERHRCTESVFSRLSDYQSSTQLNRLITRP
jgi:hypothetical protein